MAVTAEQIAKVPAENIHVSRAAFGQVWTYADELATQPGPDNDYLVGLLWTCRWLSKQPVWSQIFKRMEIPPSPITRRHYAAMPETIQDEFIAAARVGRPGQTGMMADLARGALAVLEWAWGGSGRPPLELPTASAN